MYLSKATVLKLIKEKAIGVTPFSEECFDAASYELHLSNELYKVSPPKGGDYFAGKNPKEKKLKEIDVSNNSYLLQPKEFIIAKTAEVIYVSEKHAGIFDGKSSLAQIGLFTHISSVHIDPLTNNPITVEIFNASEFSILLEVGMKIGQVIFVKVSN